MRRMTLAVGVICAVVGFAEMSVLSSRAGAEPKENAGAVDKGDWSLSPMRTGTQPAVTIMHTTFETTYEQMAEAASIVEELIKTVVENRIQAEGYVMFRYTNVQQDRSKPFTLSIAMAVPEGTQPVGKYEVTTLPAFKSAGALYNGALPSIGFAYQKHFGELMASGNQPSGEHRELYLYWEGEESNNNVVWMQVGVQ